MEKELFLIDANALITPHLTYYPFDFAPSFWEQMGNHIQTGNIAVMDMVKAEITRGNDSLSEWMTHTPIGKYIDRRTPEIISKYAEVLNYLQTSPCYHEAALHEWSREQVADPWLIAAASCVGATIITFEKPVGALNPKTPCKRPKIPDVSRNFNVQTKDLFYLMRQLGFRL